VDFARGGARARPAGWLVPPLPRCRIVTVPDYAAVERALGAGLMSLGASGGFEPWRAVSGREAVDVVDALARLSGS
jgi:hypothetical protein